MKKFLIALTILTFSIATTAQDNGTAFSQVFSGSINNSYTNANHDHLVVNLDRTNTDGGIILFSSHNHWSMTHDKDLGSLTFGYNSNVQPYTHQWARTDGTLLRLFTDRAVFFRDVILDNNSDLTVEGTTYFKGDLVYDGISTGGSIVLAENTEIRAIRDSETYNSTGLDRTKMIFRGGGKFEFRNGGNGPGTLYAGSLRQLPSYASTSPIKIYGDTQILNGDLDVGGRISLNGTITDDRWIGMDLSNDFNFIYKSRDRHSWYEHINIAAAANPNDLTEGAELRMVLFKDKLGIGDFSDTNPKERLHVKGKALVEGDILANGKISTDSSKLVFTASSSGEAMIFTDKGDLYIHNELKAQDLEITPGSHPAAPDYVFESDYYLWELDEVEDYITRHKHLPEVPSAKEIAENGYKAVDMDFTLLKKVEELTLYLIEANKSLVEANQKIEQLSKEVASLKKSK